MKRLGNKNTIKLSIIALLSVAIIVLVSLTIRTFINAKRPIPSLLKDNTPLNYITRIDDDIRKAERERQEAPLYEAIRLKEEGRRLYEIIIRRQLIEEKEEELRLKPIRDAIIENAMRIREEGRYKYMTSLLTPTKPTLNAATIDVIRETKPEPIIIPVEKPIEDMRVEEKLPELEKRVPEVKTPSVPSIPIAEIIEPVVEPVVEPTVEPVVVEPIVPSTPSVPTAEIIAPVVEPIVVPEVVEPIVPSVPSVPTAEIIKPVVEPTVEPEVIESAVPSSPTVPYTEVIEPITEPITEPINEPKEIRLTHYLIKITYENTRRVVKVTDRKTGDVYSGTLDVIDGVRTLKTENNNTLTLV